MFGIRQWVVCVGGLSYGSFTHVYLNPSFNSLDVPSWQLKKGKKGNINEDLVTSISKETIVESNYRLSVDPSPES